ncbi:hypothetical protein Hanom_Chr01g00022451 [Helianthus anomalus]
MCNDCITTFCLSGPLKFTTFVVIFVKLNMIVCTFLYHSIDKINYKHLSIHFMKIYSFCFSFSKLHFVHGSF